MTAPVERSASTAPVSGATGAVARVLLDVPLMHLDRPFDYAVPEHLSDQAVAGARVKVRFAGRRVGGFVLERVDSTEHVGRLSPIDTVVSAEPVLTPQIAELARRVADHYVGTVSDVLRLAIPPRHAKVEAEPIPEHRPQAPHDLDGVDQAPEAGSAAWNAYEGGAAFLSALAKGSPVRAVATTLPGTSFAELLAHACAAVRAGAGERDGPSVLVVVPDHRDVGEVVDALTQSLPGVAVATLTADLGPAKRYRAWLSVRRGQARIVVGTRAAMFAPVADPGLLVVWDDGDDLHAEPHAPYPHVREVLAMRAMVESCALLVVGRIRTAEGERLVRSGWAKALDPARRLVRDVGPVLRTVGSDAEAARDPAAATSRIPGLALRTAREALVEGPVLVQVPRAGYLPVVACQDCREIARCASCHGPLRLVRDGAAPVCRWCGTVRADHRCAACGSTRLRAVRTGSLRTAEELGRAFTGVPVVTSGREGVLARVTDKPALVVATPGAEPVATGGYAAALLLDGDHLLHRADLRTDEEALRRWMNAASLVRPGASVVITAEPTNVVVQALVRWDPVGFAAREYDERQAAHLPPAARVATLDASPAAMGEVTAELALPGGAEMLGPVPIPMAFDASAPAEAAAVDERVRMIVRVPIARGAELAAELRRVQSSRSARKASEHVVVRIDPLDLL